MQRASTGWVGARGSGADARRPMEEVGTGVGMLRRETAERQKRRRASLLMSAVVDGRIGRRRLRTEDRAIAGSEVEPIGSCRRTAQSEAGSLFFELVSSLLRISSSIQDRGLYDRGATWRPHWVGGRASSSRCSRLVGGTDFSSLDGARPMSTPGRSGPSNLRHHADSLRQQHHRRKHLAQVPLPRLRTRIHRT